MIAGKPCIRINDEFIRVGDLLDFINENKVSPNTMIWIDFGDCNGTFLRKDAGKNWKSNNGINITDGTLSLNLSPSCLKWHEIDVKYPVKLSTDKCNK